MLTASTTHEELGRSDFDGSTNCVSTLKTQGDMTCITLMKHVDEKGASSAMEQTVVCLASNDWFRLSCMDYPRGNSDNFS